LGGVRSKRTPAREGRDTESVWTLADDPDDGDEEALAWGQEDLGARDRAFRS